MGGSESDLLSVQRLFMVQGRLRNQIVPAIVTNTEMGQESGRDQHGPCSM